MSGKYFSYVSFLLLLTKTHSICFHGEIRKISILLDWKKHLIKGYMGLLLDWKKHLIKGYMGLPVYHNTCSLRKHTYSNILRILPLKNENLQMKNSDIFLISAQNIDYGYSLELPHWGGSNEYPQSLFLIRNKKNNVYPCKPQFYYITVGFEGSKWYRCVFVMCYYRMLDLTSSRQFSYFSWSDSWFELCGK